MSRSFTTCLSALRTCRRSRPESYSSKRTQSPSFTASFLSHSYATQAPIPQKSQSTSEPITTPPSPPTFSPKIEDMVKAISQLTLLEASELVDALKCRLNITEIATPVQVAAPIASQGADGVNGQQQAAEPEKPKEKTTFNLTLTKIDATQKAKVIKEVKTIMPNMNLVEAKKFVESLPKLLKENGTKEEIEKLQKALEAVGATIQLD
ncbi:hypothetical protein CROQUDRAFT_655821 [Cronartium quercuum f. sp. fusiforme G11]|uniref:50S ribosomal protein L12, chloroplastic n=1 Tax=Cronartium quercuum f. sp. fusiforme G11 TaxID=708437 RepID=A0A9P6TDE8_9BASI|nr:hypothetical protein CROQUDRAFT_655821 [Cronartium quercuum f. sp. fusiforme G11]